MSHHEHGNIQALEKENRHLKAENQRLQQQLTGQKTPLSDDTIDGIAWVIVIGVACTAVVFWLACMPS